MTELNMDRICELLAAKGIKSYVEQTGGGCATIYAGTKTTKQVPGWADGKTYEEDRWTACAGPGWFNGPDWTNARADTGDFSVGPDDDGESEAIIYAQDDWTEERAAAALQYLIEDKSSSDFMKLADERAAVITELRSHIGDGTDLQPYHRKAEEIGKRMAALVMQEVSA